MRTANTCNVQKVGKHAKAICLCPVVNFRRNIVRFYSFPRLPVSCYARPHRLHTVHEMMHIATDVARSVVSLSVCLTDLHVSDKRVSCAKTAEPIEMPFGD